MLYALIQYGSQTLEHKLIKKFDIFRENPVIWGSLYFFVSYHSVDGNVAEVMIENCQPQKGVDMCIVFSINIPSKNINQL